MGGFGKKGTKCDLYKFTTCNIYANVQLPQVSFFFFFRKDLLACLSHFDELYGLGRFDCLSFDFFLCNIVLFVLNIQFALVILTSTSTIFFLCEDFGGPCKIQRQMSISVLSRQAAYRAVSVVTVRQTNHYSPDKPPIGL